MSGTRETILGKLAEAEQYAGSANPSEFSQFYGALAEARSTTVNVLDGFQNVLVAAQACRDLQKAYFSARKAGLSGHVELKQSKDAEKILDNLVKFWNEEMAPPSAQTSLF